MKISIVTPVFNDRRVGCALDSILSQRHEHELELIVVDAGSTDGTMEILRGYEDRIAILVSEPDDGIYDGMNKGVRLATGDVVGILSADNRYADDFVLRDVMEVFSKVENDACYGNTLHVNQYDEVVMHWNPGRPNLRKFLSNWMPSHSSFFVRRRVYECYGLYDQTMPISADFELTRRLVFKHRIKVEHIDRVLVRFALGGASSRQVWGIIMPAPDIVRAWRIHYPRAWVLFLVARFVYRCLLRPVWQAVLPIGRTILPQGPKK
ncbi:MAG: glycosyltransferase [Dehalococcoidia bacterium]|nr:glycosyltransferase [Dehalococcoidia bacterium]